MKIEHAETGNFGVYANETGFSNRFDSSRNNRILQPVIDADAIRADAEILLNSSDPESDGFRSLFKMQTANRWLEDSSKRPAPKMLFGEFWFEGEICILFADTNVGKSILAVQIADAISRNASIYGIPSDAPGQTVIYFDFELSDKQFEARYSEKRRGDDFYTNPFVFDQNLLRAEIDPDADIEHDFESFEEYLNFSLKRSIADSGAKILIIDNLTYLKNETERARDALPLMKHLKALKSRFDLSILALAHTPKRDLSKPITRNDLQGSKMLINFCDSSFAIGESSRDKTMRYLKQIKCRNAEIRFDTENVMLGQIQKPGNFLHFEFSGFGTEREHLRDLSETDKSAMLAQAKQLSADGKTQREIADIIGVSAMTVNRYLRTT